MIVVMIVVVMVMMIVVVIGRSGDARKIIFFPVISQGRSINILARRR